MSVDHQCVCRVMNLLTLRNLPSMVHRFRSTKPYNQRNQFRRNEMGKL